MVREEVRSLLSVEDAAEDGFLSSPHEVAAWVHGDIPPLPAEIGGYQLVRRLGAGASGLVHEALQAHPERSVALKILHPGLLTEAVAARFEREAQVLGQLHHPGIARVYEAGVDPNAQGGAAHYIAMELVDGISPTEFAARELLGLRQRLELFGAICEAVAHAHERGIVHRDLKPANILVADDGCPKLIDFGVARVLDLQAGAMRTQTGQVIGTVAYMSPEQAAGRTTEIDERSDVYSLGVLLHELLTGQLPHDLSGLALAEALHVVQQENADRLGSVNRNLRGDIETIVGKALAKDPEQRYATAQCLLDDLRRHLATEPILARPPSISYRSSRFLQRHRVIVGATLVIMASMLLGLLRSLYLTNEMKHLAMETSLAHYQARVSAAAAALDRHDASAVRRDLTLAPEEHRGWEWRHLEQRRQQSRWTFSTGATDERSERRLFFSADGARVIVYTAAMERVEFDLVSGRARSTALEQRPGVQLRAAAPRQQRLLIQDGERLVLRGADLERDVTLCRRDPGHAFSGLSNSSNVGWFHGRSFERRLPHGRSSRQLHPLRYFNSTTGELFPQPRAVLAQDAPVIGPAGRRALHAEHLVDVNTGELLLQIDGAAVSAAAFSPTGQVLVTGHEDGSLRGWRMDARPVHWWSQRGTSWVVDALQVGPEASRVVVVQLDGEVSLRDGTDGRLVATLGRLDLGEKVAQPVFSPDGEMVAVPGSHFSILLVSAEDGTPVRSLLGHEQYIEELCFSADGSTLASLDRQGQVRVWNLSSRTPQVLNGHASYVYGVSVSPDGRHLASASWDGTVRAWDLSGKGAPRSVDAPRAENAYGFVKFSPIGDALLSAHAGYLTLWTWPELEQSHVHHFQPSDVVQELFQVTAVDWHPSGKMFAATTRRRPLHVWTPNNDEPPSLEVWPVEAIAMDFSPNGDQLALALPSGELQLWNIADRSPVLTLVGHEGIVRTLRFSPNGERLASAGHDHAVRIWDVESGAELHVLQGHSGRAYAAAWHPTEERLATGGGDGVVHIWDARRGDALVGLRGHDAYVFALDFTPDGATLVSGSGDTTVRLWETQPIFANPSQSP